MEIAVCSTKGDVDKARKIAKNLQEKDHTAKVVAKQDFRKYLDAVGRADAMLVVAGDGEVSLDMAVAMVLADYLGKGLMATSTPYNEAMDPLLSLLNIKVV